ncbi:hypothetical protein FRB97_004806 [Tulasnella sp. 331]|nr:hypothetical protein FRB97_004806 [Tulasnella sp. 331]
MESVTPIFKALSIPEVLDNILFLAEPSSQATAAQTCQHWSIHSLPWLWRDMKSFYPIFELLSELECVGGLWEFTSELFNVDWERFVLYTGYIRSVDYDQRDLYRGCEGLLSRRALGDIFLHYPKFENSMFPRLARVQWTVDDRRTLLQLLIFLVPSVTSLLINCRGPMEDACINILNVLKPRNILLTELKIALPTHTQALLETLSRVLANQKRLIRVGLPYYTASRQVVKALAELPFLEDYGSWTFVEYQAPLGIGMDFDWEEGEFTALKTLRLITSFADAAKVMSRHRQPHLNDFTLTSRDFLEYIHPRNLCSSLSTFQPSLTVLYLSLYSQNPDPSLRGIPFDLFRPLLLCTALSELRILSDMAMTYNDEDITSMASAWSSLRKLALCADPASSVGLAVGQPLRSVESFTRSFCALQELSLYLNTLDTNMKPRIFVGSSQARLSVLDFGTSPVPTDSTGSPDLSKVAYVVPLLEPHAEIKSERSASHMRFLKISATTEAEYSHREEFWSSFATEIHNILSGAADPTQEIPEPPC